MATLVPTPVSVANLGDISHAINAINPAAAQAVSPRHGANDTVIVECTDVADVYYVQKSYKGEWVRGGSKDGQADDATVPQVITPA